MSLTKAFKEGNYEQALIDTYIKFDEILRNDRINEYLKRHSKRRVQNIDSDFSLEAIAENTSNDKENSSNLQNKIEIDIITKDDKLESSPRKFMNSHNNSEPLKLDKKNLSLIGILEELKLTEKEFLYEEAIKENLKIKKYDEFLFDFTKKYEHDLRDSKENCDDDNPKSKSFQFEKNNFSSKKIFSF